MIDQRAIERTLESLNAAENARARSGVEETIAAIDRVMAPSVEGWVTGEHRPGREAERAVERLLFADLSDYHRSIERRIVDPPFASIAWKVSGTSCALGRGIEIVGATHFEFDGDGRVLRYWMFFDQSGLLG